MPDKKKKKKPAPKPPQPSLAQRAKAWWTNVQVRGLQQAHTRELALLGDPAHAARLGLKDTYCRLATLLPKPAGDTRILEVGCGPGKYVALLSGLGFRVVGVDPISFPDWAVLRERHGCELRDQVFGESLPFPDRSFDHVTCLGTLHYVKDPDQCLQEMRRVLKPGGKIMVRTVNRENYYTLRTGKPLDPASNKLYNMAELADVVRRNGFVVEDQFAYGHFPGRSPMLYWYLISVWFPYWLNDTLSNLCPVERRHNNIVLARLP